MNKRDLILDTMEELIKEELGKNSSVSDIAKRAGIGKGSIYYYFKSKDEIIDALIDRTYSCILQNAAHAALHSNGNAIEKLAILLAAYQHSIVNNKIDECLHHPENANIHQKSLVSIQTSLSNIVASILEQGVKEGIFVCEYPLEIAEIALSAFVFLLDPGLFPVDWEKRKRTFYSLAQLLEKGLQTPCGSFEFLYN